MKHWLKNNWKKLSVLAAALIVAGTVGGFAVSKAVAASSLDSARAAASLKVPQTAELTQENHTDSSYRFEYRDPDMADSYRVVIDRKDKNLIQVRQANDNDQGAADILLSKDNVIDLIRAGFPEAKVTSISLEREEELYIYNALFTTQDMRGQYLINPETGLILERYLRYGTPLLVMDVNQGNSDDANAALVPQNDAALSLAEARVIALDEVPGGKLRRVEYSEVDGQLTIMVTLERDNDEIELQLDGLSGQVRLMNVGKNTQLTSETEPTAASPKLISAEEVKAIVGAKAGSNASFDDPSLNHDNDRFYYVGKVFVPGHEYEYNVDAFTGAITWWYDNLDDDDDYSQSQATTSTTADSTQSTTKSTTNSTTKSTTVTPTYDDDDDWDDWDDDEWDDDDWDDWDDDDDDDDDDD